MTIEEPEPPLDGGLVTLRQYGKEIGRTVGTLWAHWRPRDGFPQPADFRQPDRHQGGGRPEPVYWRADLDEFRATQPDLWGRRNIRLIVGYPDSARVTLAAFTEITSVAADPDSGGCPPAGPDGLRRLGDLAAWQQTRSAAHGPELALTALGPDELVTLGAFARLVGRSRKTVTQYRDRDGAGFPPAAGDRQWHLGTLAAWWNSRPGSGRRPAPPARPPAPAERPRPRRGADPAG